MMHVYLILGRAVFCRCSACLVSRFNTSRFRSSRERGSSIGELSGGGIPFLPETASLRLIPLLVGSPSGSPSGFLA